MHLFKSHNIFMPESVLKSVPKNCFGEKPYLIDQDIKINIHILAVRFIGSLPAPSYRN